MPSATMLDLLPVKYGILQQNANSDTTRANATMLGVQQQPGIADTNNAAAMDRARLASQTQLQTAEMNNQNALDVTDKRNQGSLNLLNSKANMFGMSLPGWGTPLVPGYGGLPGYRRGGDVAAGQPIIVGEDGREDYVPAGGLPMPVGRDGPEVIVPGRNGIIVPNARTVAAAGGLPVFPDRQDAHDAATGILQAMPSTSRTLSQQTAVDRQRLVEAYKTQQYLRRRALQGELADADRKRRELEVDRKANPAKYWRDAADSYYMVSKDSGQDLADRMDANHNYMDLIFSGDRNDALGRRVDYANSKAGQLEEKDAAQRKTWEDAILKADEDGLLPPGSPDAKRIRTQRLEEARQGLGLPTAPPVPDEFRPGSQGQKANEAPSVAAPATSPDWQNTPQGQTVVGTGSPNDPYRYSEANPAAAQTNQVGGLPPRPTAQGDNAAQWSHAYMPTDAVIDASAGRPVDEAALGRTLDANWSGGLGRAVAGGVTSAVTGAIRAARAIPSASDAIGFLKPSSEDARAGVDWAVNRPVPTGTGSQAAPEVQRTVDAVTQAMAKAGELGALYGSPTALAAAGAAKAVGGLLGPAMDVGGRIVRNFGRAARGLPTYTDDPSQTAGDLPNRRAGGY